MLGSPAGWAGRPARAPANYIVAPARPISVAPAVSQRARKLASRRGRKSSRSLAGAYQAGPSAHLACAQLQSDLIGNEAHVQPAGSTPKRTPGCLSEHFIIPKSLPAGSAPTPSGPASKQCATLFEAASSSRRAKNFI